MKKVKFAAALAALAFSTQASAMPEQVSPRWYSNMLSRIGVLADNPGFCRAHPESWYCW